MAIVLFIAALLVWGIAENRLLWRKLWHGRLFVHHDSQARERSGLQSARQQLDSEPPAAIAARRMAS
jgi:hypothetical protein